MTDNGRLIARIDHGRYFPLANFVARQRILKGHYIKETGFAFLAVVNGMAYRLYDVGSITMFQ